MPDLYNRRLAEMIAKLPKEAHPIIRSVLDQIDELARMDSTGKLTCQQSVTAYTAIRWHLEAFSTGKLSECS